MSTQQAEYVPPKVNWDNAGDIMRRCGELEDSFAMMQFAWTNAIEEELKLSEHLDTMRYSLRDEAVGAADADRKAWVENEVRKSEDYISWIDLRAEKLKYAAMYDILSKRLSACQSVLKRLEVEQNPAKFGKGSHPN